MAAINNHFLLEDSTRPLYKLPSLSFIDRISSFSSSAAIMASKFFFICIAFFVVLCFVIMKEATTDCNAIGKLYGCFFVDQTADISAVKSHNRKVLRGLREKMQVAINDESRMKKSDPIYGNEGDNLNKWEELRKVPSGPDPLHHNGNNHKKPRSP